jgi:hypothetical protein
MSGAVLEGVCRHPFVSLLSFTHCGSGQQGGRPYLCQLALLQWPLLHRDQMHASPSAASGTEPLTQVQLTAASPLGPQAWVQVLTLLLLHMASLVSSSGNSVGTTPLKTVPCGWAGVPCSPQIPSACPFTTSLQSQD